MIIYPNSWFLILKHTILGEKERLKALFEGADLVKLTFITEQEMCLDTIQKIKLVICVVLPWSCIHFKQSLLHFVTHFFFTEKLLYNH